MCLAVSNLYFKSRYLKVRVQKEFLSLGISKIELKRPIWNIRGQGTLKKAKPCVIFRLNLEAQTSVKLSYDTPVIEVDGTLAGEAGFF